jgi:hypothetical protein
VNDAEVLRRYIELGIPARLYCQREPTHPTLHVLDDGVLLCVRCGYHWTPAPGTIRELRRRVQIEEGRILRDAAVASGEAAADEVWKGWARQAVQEVCREADTFTTDEAAERLDKLLVAAGAEAGTHDPRAWGGVMRHAAGQGWCEATGDMRLTVNPSAHRRPKRVWRSLLR